MYHGNLAALLGVCLARGRPALAWNIRTSMDDPSLISQTTRAIVKLCAHLSPRVNSIVYNSARSREQHHSLGYARGSDVVIPNGFDLDLWRHSDTLRTRARAELKLDANALVVGYVGRGDPVKDVPTLLRAFASIRARHPGAFLVCIGRDIETQRPDDVPVDGIHFLGQRNDVARLIPAFDLFCLSSRVEAFPNVIGEAMACAVPCVTTDVGDAADVVGDTGWVVPPADPAAYARALDAALSVPPDERVRRGLAARQRIEQRYALPSIAARYVEMYRQTREPN
jgi:glycosyltransferase involved in cell wall biosynthesis